MSLLTLEENAARYQIRAYKPGIIQVNNQVLTNSIIVTSDTLIENWRPEQISDLTRDDLHIMMDLQPTILLIGTGENLVFPDIAVYGHLLNKGIGVEIMSTSAACRTYAVLTSENRHVAAALVIR